jgi:hypothetical protein
MDKTKKKIEERKKILVQMEGGDFGVVTFKVPKVEMVWVRFVVPSKPINLFPYYGIQRSLFFGCGLPHRFENRLLVVGKSENQLDLNVVF